MGGRGTPKKELFVDKKMAAKNRKINGRAATGTTVGAAFGLSHQMAGHTEGQLTKCKECRTAARRPTTVEQI